MCAGLSWGNVWRREVVHLGMESFQHALDQKFVKTVICCFLFQRSERYYLDFTAGGIIAAINVVLCFDDILAYIAQSGRIFCWSDEVHSV